MRSNPQSRCTCPVLVITVLTVFATSALPQGGIPLWTNSYKGPGNSEDNPVAISASRPGTIVITGNSRDQSTGLLRFATLAYSPAGQPLWTNLYAGDVTNAAPAALALDTKGNVLVTGYSMRSSGNRDYTTIKYSAGGVPTWTNYFNGLGDGDDNAAALAVDGSGNVIVTGVSSSSAPPTFNTDVVTIKYSGAGVPLWTNWYDGGVDDEASAIALDQQGRAFVAASSLSAAGDWDFVTIAYSSNGSPIWTNLFNEPTDDIARAISVDHNGNIYVTGQSAVGQPNYNYVTIKYSGAGIPQWTNRYNGPANDSDVPLALAIGANDSVIVTGYSYGTNGNAAATTIAYSNTGLPLWTNRYEDGGTITRAIATDALGNIFVPGSRYHGDNGYATIAYSATGVPIWTNKYDSPGTGDDSPSGIAVDNLGNVFVTGYAWNGSNHDYLTIKYSSSVPTPRLDLQKAGNQLVLIWTNAFNLQSAPAVTGTFTNIAGATSPYTNPLSGQQRYFRLSAQ